MQNNHNPMIHMISVSALLLVLFCSDGASEVNSVVDRLSLAPGFSVTVFAAGLGKARGIGISPEGDLFVCVMKRGELVVLSDEDGDGVSDKSQIFVGGLRNPHSVAFYNGYVYVGESDKIRRFRDDDNDFIADGEGEVVVAGLPTRGHFTKTVVFGPDGMMYVSIGSSCNICDESDPRRATVM